MKNFLSTTTGVLLCALVPTLGFAQSAKSVSHSKTPLSVAVAADEHEPKLSATDLKEDLREIARDRKKLARDLKHGNQSKIAKDRAQLAEDLADFNEDTASPSS